MVVFVIILCVVAIQMQIIRTDLEMMCQVGVYGLYLSGIAYMAVFAEVDRTGISNTQYCYKYFGNGAYILSEM